MPKPRRIFLGIGLAFIAAVVVFISYAGVYVPLKFRYLIYQVESARTADAERRAFTLAAEWGRVWETDRITSNDAAADGRQLAGDYLLRLEWLESPFWRGGTYHAYRAVIDTNNLQFLGRDYR